MKKFLFEFFGFRYKSKLTYERNMILEDVGTFKVQMVKVELYWCGYKIQTREMNLFEWLAIKKSYKIGKI